MRNCYFTSELSDEIWGPDALSYDDVQKLVFKYKYVLSLEMNSSWNFPALAEPSYEGSEPSWAL